MSEEERYELKKNCRVCGRRVPRLYRGSGGKRCAACLHRTHRDHLAENSRVCLLCMKDEKSACGEYGLVPPSISLALLTDVHFGEGGAQQRADLMQDWLAGRTADYILVSGDLTGRAGGDEYRRAARWIREVESTGSRVAVVPGNHDIGYWGNFMSVGRQAIGRKYHRWIRIIDRPIDPCVRGPGCVVLGLNSAHGISPARFLMGYLNRFQRARAVELFRAAPPDHLKIVFCHHPLVRFPGSIHRAMYRAGSVREELAAAGVRLFLWGHQHSFAAAELPGPYKNCFAVQGPTLSDRIRDGDYPGFTWVEWHFNQRVLVRTFYIDESSIKEGKDVEFPLQGGTTASFVE